MRMNDTERINWLEAVTRMGVCPALVNDDNGHWVVIFDGIQSLPSHGQKPVDISTTFFIKAKDWKKTIRQALDAAIQEHKRTHGR